MTESGQDVHDLIGEVIIAHRHEIDSPYLDAIHALRVMFSADPDASDETVTHALHVIAYAIRMLTSESDYSNEKSLSSIHALSAITSVVGQTSGPDLPDPWTAPMGDDHA